MKKKNWIWTTGAILLVVLLLNLGLKWVVPSFSAQTLTEEEANTVALGKYPGDIIKTTKTKDEYQIEMQLETGVYFIKIDAKNGDILSLEQHKKAGILVNEEPHTAEIIEPTKVPSENKVISEKEAMAIAANHLKGKADNDVEFHQFPGQTPYYLVEVEIGTGDDEREADVQIDAYTGTVKSVNWDD